MNQSSQNKQIGSANLLDSALAFYEAKRALLFVICLVLMGACGSFLFLWGTAPHGIGIRSDSVAYLWSAKNLAKGIGLGTQDAFGKFKPLIHFPPLYPTLLAAFETLKISGMIGARWLGALFIGLLILLFGVIIYRLTNRSFWFPTIGVLVLLFMPAFWDTSIYAMTEPLYILCSLTGLICLDCYSTTSRRHWLLIAAVLFGLSFLTRYIGISVIAAGLLFILLRKKIDVKRKLQDLLILGSISLLPMLIWLMRNKLLGGSATNRSAQYVPITEVEWQSTFNSLITWVDPIREAIKINFIYLLILFLSLEIAFLFLRRKEHKSVQLDTHLPELLLLYATTYIFLTIASRLWADPTIPLYENRILYPFLSPLFFLVLGSLHWLLGLIRKRSTLLAVFATGFFVIIGWSMIRSNSSPTFPYLRPLPVMQSHYSGLGLLFRSYLNDDFINVIVQLSNEDLFFTDDVERLYFYTQKPSSYIGDLTSNDINVLRKQSFEHEVVVVFFHHASEKQQALLHYIPTFQLTFSDDVGRSVYVNKRTP